MSYIYQRSIEAVPLFVLYECADWMVTTQRARTQPEAMLRLNYLSKFNTVAYKAIISAYLESIEPAKSETTSWNRNVNIYNAGPSVPYGEPHMWYKRAGL